MHVFRLLAPAGAILLGSSFGIAASVADPGLSSPRDPAAECRLSTVYTYTRGTFPLGHFGQEVTLSPPGSYTHRDLGRECSPALPACGAPGVISLSDILRDLEDPDVQSALEAPARVEYSSSPALVESFTRADERGFSLSANCRRGGARCPQAPAGVLRLLAHMRELDAQQLRAAECVASVGGR